MLAAMMPEMDPAWRIGVVGVDRVVVGDDVAEAASVVRSGATVADVDLREATGDTDVVDDHTPVHVGEQVEPFRLRPAVVDVAGAGRNVTVVAVFASTMCIDAR